MCINVLISVFHATLLNPLFLSEILIPVSRVLEFFFFFYIITVITNDNRKPWARRKLVPSITVEIVGLSRNVVVNNAFSVTAMIFTNEYFKIQM